jgi:hypothetical protein
MNYLNALKKEPPKEIKKDSVVVLPKISDVKETIDEMYLKNAIDSEKIFHLNELRDLCEDFINECALLDEPLLIRHFLGLDNFTNMMIDLFEETMTVEISENIDEISESEEDLDPSDLYDL